LIYALFASSREFEGVSLMDKPDADALYHTLYYGTHNFLRQLDFIAAQAPYFPED